MHQIGAWRAALPEGKRYRSHRALRQVLQAAVRWRWIEDNAAALIKNPSRRRARSIRSSRGMSSTRSPPSSATTDGPLVVFLAGTGVRPEEAFGAEWRDVDLERRVFRCGAGSPKAG